MRCRKGGQYITASAGSELVFLFLFYDFMMMKSVTCYDFKPARHHDRNPPPCSNFSGILATCFDTTGEKVAGGGV
jgi:hypothetical protein